MATDLPNNPDTLSDPVLVKQALDADPTTNRWWCPSCRRVYSPGKPCSDCARHQAIGVLVGMLIWATQYRRPLSPGELTALDAIAALLGNVTAMRRRHNKELLDEQLGAQRDARSAYGDGLLDGQRGGDGW